MAMSAIDYRLVAQTIATERAKYRMGSPEDSSGLTYAVLLADQFQAVNDRFDRDRFLRAASKRPPNGRGRSLEVQHEIG